MHLRWLTHALTVTDFCLNADDSRILSLSAAICDTDAFHPWFPEYSNTHRVNQYCNWFLIFLIHLKNERTVVVPFYIGIKYAILPPSRVVHDASTIVRVVTAKVFGLASFTCYIHTFLFTMQLRFTIIIIIISSDWKK